MRRPTVAVAVLAAASLRVGSAVSIGGISAQVVDPAAGGSSAEDGRGEEVVAERTAFSTTFETAVEGVFETEIHAGPVNYETDTGEWAPIDVDLDDQDADADADAAFVADQGPVTVTIGRQPAEGALVTVAVADGPSVGYTFAGASEASTATLEDSDTPRQVTFRELAEGVDVRLESVAHGVKEDIVLASAEASRELLFPLTVEGVTARADTDGGISFLDDADRVRLRMPPGFMVDSSQPEQRTGATSTGVTLQLVETADEQPAVRVALDDAWLDDPARVYPVTIDPSLFMETPDADTYIDDATTLDRSTLTTLEVGAAAGDPVVQHRAFLRFSGLDALPAGANVQSAGLLLTQIAGPTSCQSTPLEVYRITEDWEADEVDAWPGPTVAANPSATVNTAAGAPACPARQYGIDVGELVQDWLDGTHAHHGFALRSGNETDPAQRKQLASSQASTGAPLLSVIWSEASAGDPLVPTDLAPTGVLDAFPTELSATYEDLDSDADLQPEDGWVAFIISEAATGTFVALGDGDIVESGETSAWQIPPGTLQPGTDYQFFAWATDTTPANNASRRSEPETFTTPPSACPGDDDPRELDDIAAMAKPIEDGTPLDGFICDDPDVLTFTAAAGDDLTATLTFTHTDGDLDLALYSATGTPATPVAHITTADSRTDNETITATNLAAGTYYLEIYGYQGASNTYTVTAEYGA